MHNTFFQHVINNILHRMNHVYISLARMYRNIPPKFNEIRHFFPSLMTSKSLRKEKNTNSEPFVIYHKLSPAPETTNSWHLTF